MSTKRPRSAWKHPSLRPGFTVIEVILVIAVLGVLLAIGFPMLRSPDARVLSGDITAILQRGRFEAIKRDVPVAVVFRPDAGTVDVRLPTGDTGVSAVCVEATSSVLADLTATQYRATQFTANFAGGSNAMVWLPNGRAVTCAGAPDVSGEIIVSDSRRTVGITIDIGGRTTRQ